MKVANSTSPLLPKRKLAAVDLSAGPSLYGQHCHCQQGLQQIKIAQWCGGTETVGVRNVAPTKQPCDRFEDVQETRGGVARPGKFDAVEKEKQGDYALQGTYEGTCASIVMSEEFIARTRRRSSLPGAYEMVLISLIEAVGWQLAVGTTHESHEPSMWHLKSLCGTTK